MSETEIKLRASLVVERMANSGVDFLDAIGKRIAYAVVAEAIQHAIEAHEESKAMGDEGQVVS